MRISFWWFLIAFSNISLFWNNYRISAHFTFSEHIRVLRQLPESMSMHLRTYVKMLETVCLKCFCILTDKMWNLDSRNNLEVLHNIIFAFCELFWKLWTWNLFWIMDYTQKRHSGFVSKTRQRFKYRICLIMKNLTLSCKKNLYYNFDFFLNLKLWIVVRSSCLIVTLVIVFTIDNYSGYRTGIQKPSLSMCARF